jgi:hypothetical protein
VVLSFAYTLPASLPALLKHPPCPSSQIAICDLPRWLFALLAPATLWQPVESRSSVWKAL